MHDLRKKALIESGKTLSRKARSRESTPGNSRLNTPASSRAASKVRGVSSRVASDDENDGDLSDETSHSTGSIDEVLNGDIQVSGSQLADRIEEIFARKGSTILGREKCYQTYAHMLAIGYSEEDIRGKEDELVAAFLRSIKEERSEKEAVLAAKAITLTIVTSPSDVVYDAAAEPLQRAIVHARSTLTKAAAIRTLSICAFYGGASEDDILKTMEFLLEIVTSDGHTISAPDEPEPVIAALEEWGFLCTMMDDMSAYSEDVVEAFVEQLSSSYAGVQIAAGENVALLYEKSFRASTSPGEESPGEFAESDIITDPDEEDNPSAPKMLRLYPAYRRTDQLLHTLNSLSRNNMLSVHQISKEDRKAVKTNFTDIANSIEYPHRGPKYSNAINDENGSRYGSRMTVKINKEGTMRIDRWWKLHRLKALRRVLQSGFVEHYEKNEVVFDTLPIMMAREG